MKQFVINAAIGIDKLSSIFEYTSDIEQIIDINKIS